MEKITVTGEKCAVIVAIERPPSSSSEIKITVTPDTGEKYAVIVAIERPPSSSSEIKITVTPNTREQCAVRVATSFLLGVLFAIVGRRIYM